MIGGAAAAWQILLWVRPSAPDRTEIVLWDPGVVDREIDFEGACINESVFSDRDDARACRADGVIFDPCFIDLTLERATCPIDPSEGSIRRVDFASDLDEHPLDYEGEPRYTGPRQRDPHIPWFIELDDGTRCSRARYDGGDVAGRSRQYACSLPGGPMVVQVVLEEVEGGTVEFYVHLTFTPEGQEAVEFGPAATGFDLLQDGAKLRIAIQAEGSTQPETRLVTRAWI